MKNQKNILYICSIVVAVFQATYTLSMDNFRTPFVGPEPLWILQQKLIEPGLKSSTFHSQFRADELTPEIVNWVDNQNYPDLGLPVGTTLAHKLAVSEGYQNKEEQELLMNIATDKGIDWNAQDSLGNTAAHYAVHVASLPNIKTDYGIRLRSKGMKRKVVALYLAEHAPSSFYITNHEGKTALDNILKPSLKTKVEDLVSQASYLLK